MDAPIGTLEVTFLRIEMVQHTHAVTKALVYAFVIISLITSSGKVIRFCLIPGLLLSRDSRTSRSTPVFNSLLMGMEDEDTCAIDIMVGVILGLDQ